MKLSFTRDRSLKKGCPVGPIHRIFLPATKCILHPPIGMYHNIWPFWHPHVYTIVVRFACFYSNTGAVFFNSLLYAFQCFYAYFLMMVFMTYNGYFICAIIGGFFIGRFFVALVLPRTRSPISPQTPCH